MNDDKNDLLNLDLTKLNLVGCGLILCSMCCCCGGSGAEFWLLAELMPDGGMVPKLIFIFPWIGAVAFFWVVRTGLEANGISIFRKPPKKKKRRPRRRDYEDDDDDDR